MAQHVLTDPERVTLIAAMASILPEDESGPGAIEAGAMDFVDSAIARGYCRQDLGEVISGLQLLNQCASAMTGRNFAACDAEDRNAVLARLREAPHPSVLRVLTSLVRLTLAGFLSAPRHGGNRHACGWAFMGFVPHARTLTSERGEFLV